MILLENIDIDRVNLVRDGKLNDRGCGKTTERMLALLSYAQQYNDNKKYLFIGENISHVQEVYHYFYYWILDSGLFPHEFAPSILKYDVTFPAPSAPTGFFQKIITFFEKRWISPVIQFHFTSASTVNVRGLHYDKIILDISKKTYNENKEKIKNALLAEKQ